MNIIPLAGKSSRFKAAGYLTPKYLLDFQGKSILEHILYAFSLSERLLCIVNVNDEALQGVTEIIVRCGFHDFDVVELDDTQGQLETVYLGMIMSRFTLFEEHIWIFNGDTIRRSAPPEGIFVGDGPDIVVEVFNQSGDHWSFVDTLGNFSRIAEKQRISSYCSTGLYGFKSGKLLIDFMESNRISLVAGELYVSGFIADMILKGFKGYSFLSPLNDFLLAGTPEEYEQLLDLNV